MLSLAKVLLLILTVCLVEGRVDNDRVTSFLPGSPMIGEAQEGFVKLLNWILLDDSPDLTCKNKMGDFGSTLTAVRTNRCQASNFTVFGGNGTFSLEFSTVASHFFLVQANGTHLDYQTCNSGKCNECSHVVVPQSVCLPGTNALRLANEVIDGPCVTLLEYQKFLPVLPSPMVCLYYHEFGDCRGEIYYLDCKSDCYPVGYGFAQWSCSDDGKRIIAANTCYPKGPAVEDYSKALGQCRQSQCAFPVASVLEPVLAAEKSCITYQPGNIGYSYASCTLVRNSTVLNGHPCAGMTHIDGVFCEDGSRVTSTDGRNGLTVDGDWVTNDKFIVRDPQLNIVAVSMRGDLSPNGGLELVFSSYNELASMLGKPLTIFSYAAVVANQISAKKFSGITVSDLSGNKASAGLCVRENYGTTTLTVTISQCSTSVDRLSAGAIAGVVVGSVAVAAILIGAIVGTLFHFRRSQSDVSKVTKKLSFSV